MPTGAQVLLGDVFSACSFGYLLWGARFLRLPDPQVLAYPTDPPHLSRIDEGAPNVTIFEKTP